MDIEVVCLETNKIIADYYDSEEHFFSTMNPMIQSKKLSCQEKKIDVKNWFGIDKAYILTSPDNKEHYLVLIKKETHNRSMV